MKKTLFSLLLVLALCFSLTTGASAASGADIYDEADLLSSAQEAQLSQKLSDIRNRLEAQVVVMTVPSLDISPDVFVENAFDTMDMGCGENHDGVLLLVCMDPREYRILSNGYAAEAITSNDIDSIGEEIVPYLSDGEYADTFNTFADSCDFYLDGYRNGFPFDPVGTLMMALVIGFVVGLVVALILKGQLKTVHQQHQANVYIKPGSMHVTTSRDLFLYRQVSRVKKDPPKSSSGKSSSSRNVGGGSF